MNHATIQSTTSTVADRNPRTVIWLLCALVALALLAMRSEWRSTVGLITSESEAAHALAIPLLIFLMTLRRRQLLMNALGPGSLWGVLLILGGLFMYAASSWPFNYGYPRQMAFVPMVAGSILAVAGWRVLKLCLPMLLLLSVAIPLGMRHFAFLIIRPETYTLAAAEQILDMMPGAMMTLDGPDLHFRVDQTRGVVALGDPNRGASLLLASLTIALFVSFISIRPLWQLMVAAVLCGPIILFCNLIRLLIHALLAMYGGAAPASAFPRTISYILALVMVYGAFVLLFWVLNRMVVLQEPQPMPAKQGVH